MKISLNKPTIALIALFTIVISGYILYMNHYELVKQYIPFLENKASDTTTKTDDEPNTSDAQVHEYDKPSNIPVPEQNIQQPTINNDTKEFYNTQITLYRHYLSEVSQLLINFFNDQSSAKQLVNIRTLELPQHVESLLSDLDEYDIKFLQQPISNKEVVYLPKLVESFIKIEKVPEALKNKDLLRKRILDNLNVIVDFFYSEDFQKTFFTLNHY